MTEFNLYGLYTKDNPEIRYIGITTKTIKQRLTGHRSASRNPKNTYKVVQWIRSHGAENIEIKLLNTFNNIEELKDAEIETIKSMKIQGFNLLNHTDGGDGVLGLPAWNKGVPMSEEQKELLREANVGKVLSDEHKDKIRENTQKYFDENGHKSVYEFWVIKYGKDEADRMKLEWFKKRSASLSGEGNPMYGRKGESAPAYGRVGEKHPMFGKHHSDEAKKIMGDKLRGRKNSLEVRVRKSKAQHVSFHFNRGLEKSSCVWCNDSTIEQEIIRRSALEDANNMG